MSVRRSWERRQRVGRRGRRPIRRGPRRRCPTSGRTGARGRRTSRRRHRGRPCLARAWGGRRASRPRPGEEDAGAGARAGRRRLARPSASRSASTAAAASACAASRAVERAERVVVGPMGVDDDRGADVGAADQQRQAREHGGEVARRRRRRLPEAAGSDATRNDARAERHAGDRGRRRMRLDLQREQRHDGRGLAERRGQRHRARVVTAGGERQPHLAARR